MDIDYALAWLFVDVDGKPRQLRFRRDGAEDADVLSGTGQLVAVIADPHGPDADVTVAISRPGVDYADIDAALHDWQDWAMITDDTVNLAEIRRRIRAAALD
jgi:hypothetical protein